MSDTVNPVLDAGHRERQALLAYWKTLAVAPPFHKYLSLVGYDAYHDVFVLPDGEIVKLETAIALCEHPDADWTRTVP